MDTGTQPHQPDPPHFGLTRSEYYHVVHTLTAYLPPPVKDTEEALIARDEAAIAAVGGMLPANANEASLAAQCVGARAQADDIRRLLHQHAGADLNTVMRLNAQYTAMVRASLSAHGHLLRAKAMRHKREADNKTCDADAWTQHVVTRSMQQALKAEPMPAIPEAEPAAPARAAERPPAPVLDTAPQAPAAAPPAPRVPVSAPVAAQPPAPASPPTPPAPQPLAAPGQPRRRTAVAEPDDPPRDLRFEADQYAVIYPRRAREIRQYGGLPPDCSFGPPDDDLTREIANGTTPILRALDDVHATTE